VAIGALNAGVRGRDEGRAPLVVLVAPGGAQIGLLALLAREAGVDHGAGVHAGPRSSIRLRWKNSHHARLSSPPASRLLLPSPKLRSTTSSSTPPRLGSW